MQSGDFFAVLIIWLLFALYLVYALVINFWVFPQRAKKVYCKDIDLQNPSTIRYKYLISVYLDDWSRSYDTKAANVYIELITKIQTKMVSFTVKPEDIINRRALLLLHRKKVMRPLTAIRAIHDCMRHNARIHLTGLKVHDLSHGAIIYYGIDRYIFYQSMNQAVVHKVIRPQISFCSEHIIAPSFIQTTKEMYSTKVIATDKTNFATHAMILRPELDWVEDALFVQYLMVSLFYFNALFLIILKDDDKDDEKDDDLMLVLWLGAILSSGLSFTATNVYAYFYRKHIKANYNRKCSPMLQEAEKESVKWSLIRNLSVGYLVIASIFSSAYFHFLVYNNTGHHKSLAKLLGYGNLGPDDVSTEMIFLIIYFIVSLTMCLGWTLVNACVRYASLKCFSSLEEIPFDSVVQSSHSTDETISNASLAMESKGPPLKLGTQQLQDELYSDQKNLKMLTGSIIVKPQKSPGWVNPEKYRLSNESKISTIPADA